MGAALDLAMELIRRESVTPDDAGCQRMLAERLLPLGFEAQWFLYGETSNVLLTHGQVRPSVWFLGHTDVVPPGPEADWSSPPFTPEVRDGVLYGRGACDMKGAVAAMVIAAERFVSANPQHRGQVGILLTSDEEGPGDDGVKRLAAVLKQRDDAPDYCLVGEPSSANHLGDTVRIGRRGSMTATLTVHGTQGHTAFPQTIDNPLHRLAPFLSELADYHWDDGVSDDDGEFPPTNCQLAFIEGGTGALNVTPASVTVGIGIRNNTLWTFESVQEKVESMLKQHGIERYDINWRLSGNPFRSASGRLRSAVVESLSTILDRVPDLNTGGGTSDGRFIAPLGSEVVELGLVNQSIHKIDEHASVQDISDLARVYEHVMTRLLT